MAQNDGNAAKQTFAHPTLTYMSSTDDNGVGAIMWHQQNAYRWVQNKHSAALTVGQVCVHKDGDAANFYEKVYDGLTGDEAMMGGIIMATSLTKDYYGWIQIYGYNAVISMYASGGTAIAAGDSLIASNATAYLVLGAASGTAPLYLRQVISLTALASSVTIATAGAGIIQCI